jgi:hypothetical protein
VDTQTAQHTPGPWYYDGISGTDAHIIHVCEGEIAEAFRDAVGAGPAEANARLIAAAPDLLAALEEMCEGWPPQNPDSPYFATYNQARAAIAKARGEVTYE